MSQISISPEEQDLRDAVASSPKNPDVFLALAAWLRSHSRSREAAQNYDTALALRPDDTTIAVKLAATLVESRELPAAESLLRRLAALSPVPSGTFLEIGKLFFLQGRRDEAVVWLQRAMQMEPDNAECCAFLGHIFASMEKVDQAMTLFQRAAQLDSRAAEPWRQMGLLIQEQKERPDHLEQAAKYLEKACALAPDKPVFHCAYGDLLLKMGRLSEAVTRFTLAREADPGFPLAIAGIITARERLGDLKGAAEFARDALSRYPSHPRVLQAFAPVSRHIGEEARAADMLEEILRRPDFTNHVRAEMHFALGKLYDRMKRYVEAFRHFEQANTLSDYRFNRETEARIFEEIMSAFPAMMQRKRPCASNRSRLPVFIVGMPRSGTTLTEQILASHPLVYGAGELSEIKHLCLHMHTRLNLAQAYPFCMSAITRRQLDSLAKTHLDRLGNMAHGMARVTDKMPHNFLSLGLIDLLFPGARVIHCRRDPMDNCLAIYTQHFNESHPYAASLSNLGYYYRLYERMMRHWNETVGIPVMDLQYEELVAEPERVIREIVAFCDLPWDDRCLRFHETKREINTPSYDQVRQPIYRTSAGRWRNYEPFLGPLLEGLGISSFDANTSFSTAKS